MLVEGTVAGDPRMTEEMISAAQPSDDLRTGTMLTPLHEVGNGGSKVVVTTDGIRNTSPSGDLTL